MNSIVSTDHCDDSISMVKTFLPIYLRNLEFQRIKAGQCIRKIYLLISTVKQSYQSLLQRN